MSFLESLLEHFNNIIPGNSDIVTVEKPKLKPNRSDTTKYAAIDKAIEDCLDNLIHHTIPDHRRRVEEDVLELHYVAIQAKHPQAEELLNEFFAEYTKTALKKWILKLLGGSGNSALKLDCLVGIYRVTELATMPVKTHLQILNVISDSDAITDYEVHVRSQWVSPTPVVSPEPPSTGVKAILRINDARGQRPDIEITTFPISIGRESDVIVVGRAVSRQHFFLRWNPPWMELHETSSQGSWINGERIYQQPIQLAPGKHMLRLGREAEGDISIRPILELEIISHTPSGFNVTPVDIGETPMDLGEDTAFIQLDHTLLAVLDVEDSSGSPQFDVLSLPFTIGRGEDQNYTVPNNIGVSAKHLTIVSLTELGAYVENHAVTKNGTSLKDELQPAEFLWPFDESIMLACKWNKNKPTRITLRHAGKAL